MKGIVDKIWKNKTDDVVIDMPYKILCWIPVESDQPEIYPTRKEALRDLENYALMQPENIFRIVRVQPGEYGYRTGGMPSK